MRDPTGGPTSCGAQANLNGAQSVAVNPGGQSAHVASAGSQAVEVFRRAANGDLTPAGASTTPAPDRTRGRRAASAPPGWTDPDAVAVSPDGADGYATSYNSSAVGVFPRAANGDLPPAECITNAGIGASAGPPGCTQATGLYGASSVAVSPTARA